MRVNSFIYPDTGLNYNIDQYLKYWVHKVWIQKFIDYQLKYQILFSSFTKMTLRYKPTSNRIVRHVSFLKNQSNNEKNTTVTIEVENKSRNVLLESMLFILLISCEAISYISNVFAPGAAKRESIISRRPQNYFEIGRKLSGRQDDFEWDLTRLMLCDRRKLHI